LAVVAGMKKPTQNRQKSNAKKNSGFHQAIHGSYYIKHVKSICVCTWSDLLFMVEKHLTVFTCLTPSFKANKERQCGSKIM